MEDLTACINKRLEKHPVDSCSIAENRYVHSAWVYEDLGLDGVIKKQRCEAGQLVRKTSLLGRQAG